MEKLERWKDIPEYEGYYQASNLGRIKSLPRKIVRTYKNRKSSSFLSQEMIINPVRTSRGYLHLTLHKDGIAKQQKIHRLILAAFIGKSDLVCNHKNGIKTDNRLENLEYCTQYENIHHAYRQNLIGKSKPLHGNENPNAKLNGSQILKIRSLLSKGVPQKKIAERFDVCQSLICMINKGHIWKYV